MQTNQFTHINSLPNNILNGFKKINHQNDEIEKAHVKSHMRKTKSGKLSIVKDYDDSRTKKEREFERGEKVKIINDSKKIENDGDMDSGWGKLLAGQTVEVVNKKSHGEYDIKLNNGNIIYDVLLSEISVKDYKEKPSNDKIDFQPFTKDDWQGFGGAEEFENGDQPLISELNVGGRSFVFIAHNIGMEAIGDDIVFSENWSYPVKTAKEAKEYLSKLIDEKDLGDNKSSFSFFRELREKNKNIKDDKKIKPEKLEFKTFTDSDWEGFAGAEKFSNGDEPLISEMKVNGYDYVVVLNNSNIQMFGYDDEKDEQKAYSTTIPFANTAERAKKIANVILGDKNDVAEMNFFKNRGFKTL